MAPTAAQEPRNTEAGEEEDDTRRHCQENSLVRVEPKTLDNEAVEGILKRIGHVLEEDTKSQHPDFGVLESFPDLVSLVLAVLDARLVGLNASDGHHALAVVEESGRGWRIGQDPPQANTDENCDDAKDDEHPLVREDARILHTISTWLEEDVKCLTSICAMP